MSETYLKLRRVLESCPREADGRRLNVYPSFPDPRDFKYSVFAGHDALPVAFDRRYEVPKVGDQGKFGTCVGFSAWLLKSWQEQQQGDMPEGGLSPLFVYSLARQLDEIPDSQGAGTTLKAAMQVLQKYGICPESLMPYSTITNDIKPPVPSSQAIEVASKYKIKAYAQLCASSDSPEMRQNAINLIRRAIVEQGPVMIAVLVTSSFLELGPDNVIPLPEGLFFGGHGLDAIGFDDSRRMYLVQSSWGEDWGDQGRAWLPYDWVTYRMDDSWWPFFEAWTAVDVDYTLHRAGRILLKIGDRQVIVDGETHQLDAPPEVVPPGRVLLPLRFISEQLGCIVNYQPATGVVEVHDPSK